MTTMHKKSKCSVIHRLTPIILLITVAEEY